MLDTSAILAGIKPPPDMVAIPPAVLEELHKKYPEIQGYRVVSPSSSSIEIAVKASKKTGDFEVLSETDIQVIALAIDLKAKVITDDYAIQNVLSFLGLEFESGEMEGIKEKRKWKWKCTGCGRYFRHYYAECPVCGSKLRRVKDK